LRLACDAMKRYLRDFIDWLEAAHLRGQPCGSEFEQSVPPNALLWAGAALDVALSSQCPVTLYSRSASPRAVVSALAFRQAGVHVENVYSRNTVHRRQSRRGNAESIKHIGTDLTAVFVTVQLFKFDYYEVDEGRKP
jgi:hypothetical protein